MTEPMERLNKYTYEVRHNPNCPSPFLIVTVGDGGCIGRPGNLYSYGKTLAEASDAALEAIDADDRRREEQFADARRIDRINSALWAVRGVVWA